MNHPCHRVLRITCLAACCLPLSSFARSPGRLNLERWKDLAEDLSIPAFQRDALAVRPPDNSRLLDGTLFAGSPGGRDGVRLRGRLKAEKSGEYTFRIEGDVNAEVWLATGGSPFEKNCVASKRSGREQAEVVRLEAGKFYEVEALIRERGTSQQGISLAWTCRSDARAELAFSPPVANPADVDRDGLPDTWEQSHGLDPKNPLADNGAYGDPDRDGIANLQEWRIGSNPAVAEQLGNGITRDRWEGIPGKRLADFTSSQRSRVLPDEVMHATSLQEAAHGSEYATRYRGGITAPVSGPYVFWIDGDGEAELWLADGSRQREIDGKLVSVTNRFGKVKLASSRSDAAEVNFDRQTSQRSRVVQLQAGETYYLEVLHKGGREADRLAVAWQAPDAKRELIPADVLSADVPEAEDPDGDCLPTSWELAHGLDPGVAEQYGDPDQDSFTNFDEFQRDTDPRVAEAGFLTKKSKAAPGIAAAGVAAKAASVSSNVADYSAILGPTSRIYMAKPDGTFTKSFTWFPDAHFPMITGGPNEPGKNLSWWMERKEGTTLDRTIASPGAVWVPKGAPYTGDTRGYWIITAYRPVDYDPALLNTSVTLDIYSTDNLSHGPVTHTIDADYLVAYAHTEDYDPLKPGEVTNHTRTIYSFDNGLNWQRGPWIGGVPAVIDTWSNPTGPPRIVTVDKNQLRETTDLATGTGWVAKTIVYNPPSFAYNSALFYSRYYGKWVSWYNYWAPAPRDHVNVTVSSDLENWTATNSFDLYAGTPGGVLNGNGEYATMLGSLSGTNTSFDMECGQLGWFYNNKGGLMGRAIHFIGQTRTDLTWTGSGGNTNLGTPGNWTLTAGGSPAFSAFVDEKHSLTFNGTTGGTLNNTIPVLNRVRGLTFGSAAGSYTINGNALQLEATRLTTGGGTMIGITNQSPNLQTVAAKVDVRTAALFLHAQNGDLRLSGDVDLRGSGGVVVSGDQDTELLGVLGDSGYTDFESGLPETIGGANAGRLVKQGNGLLTLDGTNTFTGRTDITGGSIRLDNGLALQNSVVSFDAANALVLTEATKLGGLNGTGGFSIGANALTIGNNNPPDCYDQIYTGQLSGSGSLKKTGASVQTIGSSNTYTGGTTLEQGVLIVPGGSSSFGTGTVTFNGGSLRSKGAMNLSNPIVVGTGGGVIDTGGSSITLSGALSGSGDLFTQGSGTLLLSGTNSYSGHLTIRNTVQISSAGGLGSGSFDFDGGQLKIQANLNFGSQDLIVSGSGGTLDTGSYTVTISGAIKVPSAYSFVKKGTGTLVWSGSGSDLDGTFVVEGGKVVYTRSGTPLTFSDGGVVLKGSALSIEPPGSGGNIVVNLAQTSGKKLTVEGSGLLALNRGANNSLTVNVGSVGNPNALNKVGTSTFLISPASTTANLGVSPGVKVFVPGTANTAAGATYSPSVIAFAGSTGLGDFVAYGSTNGFGVFGSYVAKTGTHVDANTGSTSVMNFTGASTLTGDSWAAGLRLSGAHTLGLGTYRYTLNGNGTEAGVILNGGTISGGTLDFGGRRGFIHTGTGTPSITSKISGTNGVTFFGAPDSMVTVNNSANDFTGDVVVNGALLSAVAGLGNASNAVKLDGQGMMRFAMNATISRAFTIGSGGGGVDVTGSYLLQIANPVGGSGTFIKDGTGNLQLNGANTFSGPVSVRAGRMTFNGGSTLANSTGVIQVENGAMTQLFTWGGVTIPNPFVISGTGVSNSGALAIQGGGTAKGSVTLAADSLIKVSSTTGGTLSGLISGAGYQLQLDGGTPGLVISGSISLGTGSLVCLGSGGVSLTGDAIYSGTTVIQSGSKLTLGDLPAGTLGGTSGVTVNGTLCGGGAIGTTGTVAVAGGVLLPGKGTTPKMLTVYGNVTLDAASELQSYVNNAAATTGTGANGGYGQLVVLGAGALDGKLRITPAATYTPVVGESLFVALRNGGSGEFDEVIVMTSGGPVSHSGAPGTNITINGVTGKIYYDKTSSQALTSGGKDVVIQF